MTILTLTTLTTILETPPESATSVKNGFVSRTNKVFFAFLPLFSLFIRTFTPKLVLIKCVQYIKHILVMRE